MTTSLRGKSIIEPDLIETLSILKRDIFLSLNCVKIGEIVSFDPAKKTAVAKLLFKRSLPDGTIMSHPELVDCPVFTLQGGGGFMQFPVASGDQCLILFSDRSLDVWSSFGTEEVPSDGRAHDLSDGICLVGLNSPANPIPAASLDAVTLSYAGASIVLKSGAVTLIDGSGAQLVFTGGLIKINNGSTTLLTLLNGLIDVISAALVQGPTTFPLTSATIAALNLYKVQLAGLLQ